MKEQMAHTSKNFEDLQVLIEEKNVLLTEQENEIFRLKTVIDALKNDDDTRESRIKKVEEENKILRQQNNEASETIMHLRLSSLDDGRGRVHRPLISTIFIEEFNTSEHTDTGE